MKKKRQDKKSEIFDILFIMILCFATLLTTMIIQGGVIVGGDGGMSYVIKFPSFILTIGGLMLYLVYTLGESNKELKKMISFIYDKKSEKEKSEV